MKTTFHRMTPQRRVILEELQKLRTHPTADELYGIVRQRLPHVSLGTVYRNLDLLWKAGKILRLENPGSPARFDGEITGHYHIHCVVCGRIDDVEGLPLGDIGEPHGSFSSYRLLGYRVEFSGVCPACQGDSESNVGGVNRGHY